jgi:carbohydrate-selective porin OprB
MKIRDYFCCAFLLAGAAFARSEGAPSETSASAWWKGKNATGDWSGARPMLSDHGLTIDGRWRGIYFGILDSANGSGNAFSEELDFGAQLDLAKALRWEKIEGVSLFGEVRWRDPGPDANPNNLVEAESLFNPSRYAGGTGWRLMNFGLRYVAPRFCGVKDGLAVVGGWIQPQKEFVEQPLARLFANNAMASAEGLGGNVPFSSSFTTWGGTIEVKPAGWHYVKTGLFMSFPEPTSPENHGLMFRGNSDPAQNGLFFLGETGVTPEIGRSKLPGRYALGAYVYGENNAEYGGNKSAYYWQADQMLWREEGEQGLRMFSLFVFAPSYNDEFSFYMHGGFSYEGLVPGRPRDQLIAAVATGNYGAGAASDGVQPSQTVLMEAGYRVRLSGWSFVQPFAQYISRPDGLDDAANAAILGVSVGVDF